MNRGLAYLFRGKFVEAIADFDRAETIHAKVPVFLRQPRAGSCPCGQSVK
jgi:hypothetical protein